MDTIYINSVYTNCDSRTIKNLAYCYEYSNIHSIIKNLIAVSNYDFTKYTGKKVLVKPNWVTHNRNESDAICLTTHPNFILALIDILLKYNPKNIIVGDAPIQGCEWNTLVTREFKESIKSLSKSASVPIEIIDFRRMILIKSKNEVIKGKRDLSCYCLFDLAKNSYLEPITSNETIFRVTDYDPDRLSISHRKGKHLYCIAKETFDVDYIIALPKAKTHQKAGITNALKIIVGLNGDKDYLPHHRVGGTGFGGDCYPGKNIFRRAAEYFLDQANRNIGRNLYKPLKFVSKVLWRLSFPKDVHHLAAGWYGNDTTWRMVMDLNMIVKFGVADGTISDNQQRSILYICDGVIAGQGNGPLNPEPLPLGIVMLSENAAQMDRALAAQMGFDINMIPLVHESLKLGKRDCQFIYEGNTVTFAEIAKTGLPTIPPPGWLNVLKSNADDS